MEGEDYLEDEGIRLTCYCYRPGVVSASQETQSSTYWCVRKVFHGKAQ